VLNPEHAIPYNFSAIINTNSIFSQPPEALVGMDMGILPFPLPFLPDPEVVSAGESLEMSSIRPVSDTASARSADLSKLLSGGLVRARAGGKMQARVEKEKAVEKI
jgi:hypothetical protein